MKKRWLVAALFAMPACAHSPASRVPAPPRLGTTPYVRAHFDRLRPDKVTQFDAGRREWLAALARLGGPDAWWGSFFEIDGLGFVAFRPLVALSDLGKSSPSAPPSPERTAATNRYNQQADEGLVFPHGSQVWERERDIEYQPPGKSIALDGGGQGRVVFEGVKPTAGDAYLAAWKAIHEVLATAHYPLARFTFSSQFGDGRVTSIWIGPPGQAPTIESVLTAAVGATRADSMLRAASEPVVSTETFPIHSRPDLSDGPIPNR